MGGLRQCWWSNHARQNQEHLFKGCREWKKNIRAGNTSGDRDGCEDGKRSGTLKSKNGLADIGKAKARLSNTMIRDLLGNEDFTEAVLS